MSPFLRDERFLDSRHRSRRRFEQRAARVGGDEAADGLRGPAPRLEVPREPRIFDGLGAGVLDETRRELPGC